MTELTFLEWAKLIGSKDFVLHEYQKKIIEQMSQVSTVKSLNPPHRMVGNYPVIITDRARQDIVVALGIASQKAFIENDEIKDGGVDV